MKKWITILVVMAFMGLTFGTVYASNCPGPAPSSGDGASDGSEWGDDDVLGPFGPGSE